MLTGFIFKERYYYDQKNNLFIGVNLAFLLVSSSSAYASSISGGYVELSRSNLKSPVSVIKEGRLALFKAKVKGKGLTPYQWHYVDGGKWLFGGYKGSVDLCSLWTNSFSNC